MFRKLVLISFVTILWLIVGLVAFKIIRKTFSSQEFVTIFQKSSDRILSYEMKPNFQKTLTHLQTHISYQTNSQGFRGRDFVLEKRPGVARIAIVGDSVAFGIGIDVDQTFPRLLEKSLSNFEVFNFSVVGYNTIQEYELLITKVLSYRPDVVILSYSLNDAAPEKDWEYKTNSRKIGLKADSNIPNEMLLYERTYGQTNGPWQQRQQYLLKIKNATENASAKLLLLILPLAYQISHPQENWVSQTAVKRFANQNNIPYLDLLPSFLNSRAPSGSLFLDESHPSVLGHKIVASNLASTL